MSLVFKPLAIALTCTPINAMNTDVNAPTLTSLPGLSAPRGLSIETFSNNSSQSISLPHSLLLQDAVAEQAVTTPFRDMLLPLQALNTIALSQYIRTEPRYGTPSSSMFESTSRLINLLSPVRTQPRYSAESIPAVFHREIYPLSLLSTPTQTSLMNSIREEIRVSDAPVSSAKSVSQLASPSALLQTSGASISTQTTVRPKQTPERQNAKTTGEFERNEFMSKKEGRKERKRSEHQFIRLLRFLARCLNYSDKK